jgi:hypothetical protein
MGRKIARSWRRFRKNNPLYGKSTYCVFHWTLNDKKALITKKTNVDIPTIWYSPIKLKSGLSNIKEYDAVINEPVIKEFRKAYPYDKIIRINLVTHNRESQSLNLTKNKKKCII